MKNLRLGIDLGGTKTEIIAIDGSNGKELFRKRVPTIQSDYNSVLKNLKNLVDEAEKNLNSQGTIGVGIPGSILKNSGLVQNSAAINIDGKPLQKDLEDIFKREVRVLNDAHCFTISEALDGAGQGAKVVFGAILGTGCGGGITVDGKSIEGINNITGEWGCNPLPRPRVYMENPPLDKRKKTNETREEYPYFTQDPDWNEYPGPLCFCGNRGCQELWISGSGLKIDYQNVTGENISTHDIIANMRVKEPKAVAAFNRYVDRVARALSTVVNLIDPHVIVLGGGMSNINELYSEIPKIWGRYIISDIIDTKLLPPRYGDSSGVRGAAWLWND